MRGSLAVKALLAAVICMVMIAGIANAQQDSASPIEGIWLGTLAPTPDMQLRILVVLTQGEDGVLGGTLRSIDQDSPDIPLETVTYTDGKLMMKIDSAGVEIEGSPDAEAASLNCEFRQGGGVFPLVFARLDEMPKTNRPQTPFEPYPYIEEEVTYRNEKAGITLAGTLTYPESGGPFTAVVLVTGSGPQNRDEELFDHKPFMVLADYLTRRGIAVLRYDDRGIGESTGDFDASTTGDFTDDALAGIAYLKTRKEINPAKIGIAGHSEGGMVAPLAATRSSDVAFIVMMAGIGQGFDDIVIQQQTLQYKALGMDEAMITLRNSWNKRLFGIIGSDLDNDAAAKAIRELYASLSADDKQTLGLTAESVEKNLPSDLRPWWRYAMGFDAPELLRQVKCPVLAINGTLDTQVPSSLNLPLIEEALETGGNSDYLIMELPGLNHLFQSAETGSELEYAKIEETMSPSAMTVVAYWVSER